MMCMFADCYMIESLDLSMFDVSNVRDFELMFCDCERMYQLNLSNWHMKDDASTRDMFNGCDRLQKIIIKNSDWKTVELIKQEIYKADIHPKVIIN